MRILTWNLFHGRSVPPADGDLAPAFAELLAAWEWDVALLQEVPPWWPQRLARACSAEARSALTSRNSLLALRRALAARSPELMKSNGGGSNAILARGAIIEHRTIRLRLWPERRVAQLVRLADGTCVANFHGSARVPFAEAELDRLWSIALRWANGGPLVLGGDLNLRRPLAPTRDAALRASRDVDHLFARGVDGAGEGEVLARRVSIAGRDVELSDHPPLRVELAQRPLRS